MKSMKPVNMGDHRGAVVFEPFAVPTIISAFPDPEGRVVTETLHPKNKSKFNVDVCATIVSAAAKTLAACYGLPLDDILDKAKELCMSSKNWIDDSGNRTIEPEDLGEDED